MTIKPYLPERIRRGNGIDSIDFAIIKVYSKCMKTRRTGNAKDRRDKAIKYYHIENPLYTHKEIAGAFGLERSSVSRRLKEQKEKILF